MSIFQKSVINKYLSNLDNSLVDDAYNKFNRFYSDKDRIENIKLLKEENYQEGFLREIFVQVLGYTINPDIDYNLTAEYKNETDAKKADGAILKDNDAIGVIELKSTKTKDLESIKEQAFIADLISRDSQTLYNFDLPLAKDAKIKALIA